MKISKKKILIIFTLSLIVFSLFINLFTTKSIASVSDITFDLNKEVLYNSNDFSYDNFFNLDNNINIFSKNYSASYSFENDTDDTNPLYWEVDEGGGSVNITSEIEGHNKVMDIYDDDNTDSVSATQTFSIDQTSGIIEFWIRITDNTETMEIRFRDNTVIAPYIIMHSATSQWSWHDGSYHDVLAVVNDVWYQMRIDFDCTPDTFDWYINDNLEVAGADFASNIVALDNIFISTGTNQDDYNVYIDAFGYTWLSNYTINDNLFPVIIFNNTLSQISGYEFAFENINDLYSQGYGSHGLFIEGWEITGNNLKIDYDYTSLIQKTGVLTWSKYRDRVVNFTVIGSGSSYLDLDNSLFITNNFINISFSLNISHYDNNGGYITIEFYSDSNQLLELRIYKTGGSIDFTYYDGGYNNIYSGLSLNTIYEIDIMLNLEIDQAYISLYENNIVIDYIIIPLFIINEPELSEIIIGVEGSVGNHIGLMLDNVGIYSNGIIHIGQNNTFGYTRISTIDKWKSYHHNLFSIIAEGNLQIYQEIWYEVVLGHGTDSYIIESFRIHNNILSRTNIYDFSSPGFPIWFESSLLIYTKQNITYNYINIEGVSLTEGINKYWLEQSFSGINSSESYFYVDNNKLQFIHISNDTNLEYIQAEFNIADISSSNYAIKFKSNIDNKAEGYFRINFIDISNIIPIPIYESTTRIFLTQNKTISSFIILITDDDDDTIQGFTTGYVSQIELLYVLDISISITTSNLVTMMIPIIIIFIPTFLLSSRTGKNSIVPIMMLMSLICGFTEIIPYWLLFIIIFPSSLFLFLKRKEGII